MSELCVQYHIQKTHLFLHHGMSLLGCGPQMSKLIDYVGIYVRLTSASNRRCRVIAGQGSDR